MRTTPALLLATLLLLAAPVAAHAAEGDPTITAADTTIELAPGEKVLVPITPLVTGTTSPGLYSGNIAVTAGPCTASFGWSGGAPGVDVEMPPLGAASCTISYLLHDAVTTAVAAEPGTITVTLPVPPTDTPTTDATPVPSPDALAPDDDDLPAAASPSEPRQDVAGWQQGLAIAAASLVLLVGSTISLTRQRRRSTFEEE